MKDDVEKIHISEVIHFCFSNDIYVKLEQTQVYYNRIVVETPKEKIVGQNLYKIGDKKDRIELEKKRDELYRYFYKKIKEEQKK